MSTQDSHPVATEQSDYATDEGNETGFQQHNHQDRHAPCA
jgi:hypothetical protein